MSNVINSAQQAGPASLSGWHSAVERMIKQISQNSQFPLQQIHQLCSSSSCPKTKQLLLYSQVLFSKYQQNCSYFYESIILMYVLLLKGCICLSVQFTNKCMEILEDLLGYRLIMILAFHQENMMSVVYSFIENLLNILIPSMLMWNGLNSRNINNPENQNKDGINKNQKSFLTILIAINKNKQMDNILLLFQSLFVHKIREHLTTPSLFEFDSFMRLIYAEQKYQLVFQGKGFIYHMSNKERQNSQIMRELSLCSLLTLNSLIPARANEFSWQIYDLHLVADHQNSNTEGNQRVNQPVIICKKALSNFQMPDWVIHSFKSDVAPAKITISFISLLNKMKVMQIFHFLCLLEIYGSSPQIQVLDQYIIDPKVLELFTKFLLGQNLSEIIPCQNFKKYQNEKLIICLKNCINSDSNSLSQRLKMVLIEQLKSQLLVTQHNKQNLKQGSMLTTQSQQQQNE